MLEKLNINKNMRNIKRDIKWEWVLDYMKELGYDIIIPEDLRNKEKNKYWYCFSDDDYVFTKDGKTKWLIQSFKRWNTGEFDTVHIKMMMDNGYTCCTGRNVYSMRQFKNDIGY